MDSVIEWLESPAGERWARSKFKQLRFLVRCEELDASNGEWLYNPGPLFQLKRVERDGTPPMYWHTRDRSRPFTPLGVTNPHP